MLGCDRMSICAENTLRSNVERSESGGARDPHDEKTFEYAVKKILEIIKN